MQFRDKTLTPLQWVVHGLMAFRPRVKFVRVQDKTVGMLVPMPLKHVGRNWVEWRMLRWSR